MQFTMSVAMTDPTQYAALAQTAEECGYHQIAVADSLFWSEQVSDSYPYTKDGSRLWQEDTPFIEPFMAVAHMAAVTTRIRFLTHVIKVATRNPLLLAKQVGSAAVLQRQPLHLRGRHRLAQGGVRVVRSGVRGARQAHRRVARRHPRDPRRRMGRARRRARGVRPDQDAARPLAAGAGLDRRPHPRRAEADGAVRLRLDQRDDHPRRLRRASTTSSPTCCSAPASRSRASRSRSPR